MSLRTYKDSLLQKMRRYQSDLKDVPREFERVAVQRFREGLDNTLMKANILMNCTGDNETLDKAFQLATNWENTMSHLTKTDDTSGTISTMAGLLGIPTPTTPTMAGLANGHRQSDDAQWEAVNTKLKEHDLKIASLTDGQNQIRSSIIEGFKEMSNGMESLRNDLTHNRPNWQQGQRSYQTRQPYQTPQCGRPPRQYFAQ